MGRHIENTPERFWTLADVRGPDDCWAWRGSINRNGYGQLSWNAWPASSHRVAYQLTHGTIPEGLFVLHSCDNKLCVNPAHLYVGTQQQNVDDMMKRGRHGRLKVS